MDVRKQQVLFSKDILTSISSVIVMSFVGEVDNADYEQCMRWFRREVVDALSDDEVLDTVSHTDKARDLFLRMYQHYNVTNKLIIGYGMATVGEFLKLFDRAGAIRSKMVGVLSLYEEHKH